ncbi:MAG TPA: GNAT family N-acetyltransferase [Baekduia sp.]|uniref:GNAT family N-acetyltransferase n=1 Tax=Baekduia sp. TaxID=2600305 RepID=UPI002B839661|nr:GNAT family N-acetyltransferase [Baekduia sp.]HMJ34941.1 GNAT family N-acetyltransferase [Baekduia sp.]
MTTPAAISVVREEDLDDLLPLMRAYCDFYEANPSDEALLAMSRALIADPQREGVQLVARTGPPTHGAAVGFATVFWTWQTLSASRAAVMNDLFVAEHARGTRIADALIAACGDEAREHGAAHLTWQTAKDNLRAQAVYERVGGRRSEWLDYDLPVGRTIRDE